MEPVALRLEEHVAWIEFGDPARRNVLTIPLLEALPHVLMEAVVRGARVVVLRGRGDVWSGGYDIEAIPEDLFDTDPERVEAHPFERCMRAVADCPLPTVAAVNGHAFGGALELAVSCDLRLAHRDARFGVPAARLGIVYSQTGLAKFVRLVGPAHTRWLFYTGRAVDATEAERIGLVNRAVDGADFDAEVAGLAADIAACAPLAVQSTKQLLQITENGAPLDPVVVGTILALRQRAYRSEDFREGRAAFTEKRPPRFQGR